MRGQYYAAFVSPGALVGESTGALEPAGVSSPGSATARARADLARGRTVVKLIDDIVTPQLDGDRVRFAVEELVTGNA